MKKRIRFALAILALGTLLTATTLLVNQKLSFNGCEGSGLHQVKKGFPLPVILLRPSVSLCNSVEPISILWEGNAYHEEYMHNLLINVLFWSGVTALAIGGFIKIRRS